MKLHFEGIVNPRELGGIKLAGGRRVKQGLLLRAAALSQLSEKDKDTLQAMSLRHIFDFRDRSERDKSPDMEVEGAEYHHIPVLPRLPGQDVPFRSLTPEILMGAFRDMYRTLAEDEHCIAAYREFFRTVLEAEGACILWHCTQGKDRTGIAAVLLLTALGAEREDILTDYFLSNEALGEKYAALRERGYTEAEMAALEKVYFVMPECIDTWFETVEKLCGSPENYLHRILGLSDADIDKLKEYYTE